MEQYIFTISLKHNNHDIHHLSIPTNNFITTHGASLITDSYLQHFVNIRGPLQRPGLRRALYRTLIQEVGEERVDESHIAALLEEGLVRGTGLEEGEQQLQTVLHHDASLTVTLRP